MEEIDKEENRCLAILSKVLTEEKISIEAGLMASAKMLVLSAAAINISQEAFAEIVKELCEKYAIISEKYKKNIEDQNKNELL